MTGLRLDDIEHADALAYLKTLPDECVNLCVTSPPYLGLRDYGTATWEGGDDDCDHRPPDEAGKTNKPTLGQRGHPGRYAGPACYKCGARRIDQQIGIEDTPAAFIARLVEVFAEVRRVLRADGNCYVNMGDSYASSPRGNTGTDYQMDKSKLGYLPKSLMGIPWRFAFAMQDAGWLLREDIIWHKPAPMPESVRDRCTRAHEYIFHFTKGPRYWYDAQAVAEPTSLETFARAQRGVGSGHKNIDGAPGQPPHSMSAPRKHGEGYPVNALRNRRSVWNINPASYKGAHFATFPEAIPELCILAACPEGGVVLDPFMGAGTVGLVAKRLNRRYLGCDLNASYVRMAIERINSIPYTLFSLMAAGGAP